MKTITTKITSFLFILLGFMPLLLVLSFKIQQQNIRHQMKEKLETQLLQTIVLPEEKVIWMDKHEIWVNNSMFDIHSKKLENGIYTFTGLYDHEETMLVKKEKDARGKSQQENKLLTQLFKCIHNIFYNQPAETFKPVPSHDYNSFMSVVPVAQFREILTPPPQAG